MILNLKKNIFNQIIRYFFTDGSIYDGEWQRDHQNGKGILYYENKDKYEGDCKILTKGLMDRSVGMECTFTTIATSTKGKILITGSGNQINDRDSGSYC